MKKSYSIYCEAEEFNYLKNCLQRYRAGVTEQSDTDIMSILKRILEQINYQPLGSNWQLILRQALFLWQYETNKRADPVNKGTPQGYPVDYFIDWCKKNRQQWSPDEEAIVNFVSQLRIKI